MAESEPLAAVETAGIVRCFCIAWQQMPAMGHYAHALKGRLGADKNVRVAMEYVRRAADADDVEAMIWWAQA
jgi:TPR repeat protein